MSLIIIHRLYNCKCSECIHRSMKSVYATVELAQCTAGMQSISETDAAVTLAE